MGSLTPSTTCHSTTTSTTISTTITTPSTPRQSPSQILEITVISAQDLSPVSKSMRTYAVVWVQPDRKLTTRVDTRGHNNPTWNDKFVFRVDESFLGSDTSGVMVEIYTVSWFRDNLVGTVHVLMSNLIPPFARPNFTTRFVALQIRRPSGSPQGILNMGVSLVESTRRSLPIYTELSPSANGLSDLLDKKIHQEDLQDHEEEEKRRVNTKIQLWRSRSEKTDLTSEIFPPKAGSMCNGSIVNGSELYSDVGPSASVVAAAIAKGMYQSQLAEEKKKLLSKAQVDDTGSSILEDLTVEEATAKGYRSKAERWRQDFPPPRNHQGSEAAEEEDRSHARRHSDAGLFSCFAYGIEFTIVCGASNKNSNPKNKKAGYKSMKRSPSDQNLSC